MARRKRSRNAPAQGFITDSGEALTFREMALRSFEPHRPEYEANKLAKMRENLAEVEAGVAAFKAEVEKQEVIVAELQGNTADADVPEETVSGE